MKIIEPSVEIMRTGLEVEFITPEQHIEKVGRTCYKSEDKITNESAAQFVSNLVKRGHEAMIEHYSLIFKTNATYYEEIKADWDLLLHNGNLYEKNEHLVKDILRPYLRFTDQMADDGEMRCIISGNMRAWRDFTKACISHFGFIPRYMHGIVRNYPIFFSEFNDYIPPVISNTILIPIYAKDLLPGIERKTHMDITVKFICDRGVSHEMVRHRVASFAQESTRYCNYSQEKFGNEITVIRPSWCSEADSIYYVWRDCCSDAETSYFSLLRDGATPQEARSVLPNSLKTEVIVTMNPDGWNHFFELRCAAGAHPDMREVANMAYELFDSRYLGIK